MFISISTVYKCIESHGQMEWASLNLGTYLLNDGYGDISGKSSMQYVDKTGELVEKGGMFYVMILLFVIVVFKLNLRETGGRV